MKAILCEQYGPPSSLQLRDLPSPIPQPNQVVITNRVAAVNFPDALIIQDKYQYKPALPFSPGGEVAGVIKAVGSAVANYKIGDKVLALTTYGGFAQEVAVASDQLVALPADLSDADLQLAGAFGMTYGTSLHALQDRAQAQAGETLLVLGASGGVGMAAIELGKRMQLRVIAAASSAEKLDAARRCGADMVIDYSREDLRERLKLLTDGRGPDIIYDPVGGDLSEPAFRSIGWNGRYLVVGFAAGTIPRLPLNLPLLKGAAVIGVFWGEFVKRQPAQNAENMRLLLEWLREGSIKPLISQCYPLSRVPEALEAMMARKVIGKVIVLPQQIE